MKTELTLQDLLNLGYSDENAIRTWLYSHPASKAFEIYDNLIKNKLKTFEVYKNAVMINCAWNLAEMKDTASEEEKKSLEIIKRARSKLLAGQEITEEDYKEAFGDEVPVVEEFKRRFMDNTEEIEIVNSW